jgi:hypothetical protein
VLRLAGNRLSLERQGDYRGEETVFESEIRKLGRKIRKRLSPAAQRAALWRSA